MGDRFDALQPGQVAFIQRQKLFFVGTAGSEGSVNVSPKGMDTLRVPEGTQRGKPGRARYRDCGA